MTSAYPPPFQRPAPEPAPSRRPLIGVIIACGAIIFGAVFLIGAIASFEFGAVLVGALMVASGIAYLRLSPSVDARVGPYRRSLFFRH